MEVPRLHVGAFSLLLLSLMALTSASVDGKYSSFFITRIIFLLSFPIFWGSCIETVHPTLKIHQLVILIVRVNSKIMKEKVYSLNLLGTMGRNEATKNKRIHC